MVSNQKDPAQPGPGFSGAWSYAGFLGLKAGEAMCQQVGADHVCAFDEIVAAEAAGELKDLPANLTYWLHRTTNVPDALQPNAPCATNADCDQLPGDTAAICDAASKQCAWKPGAGGRCNDWTLAACHVFGYGEFFRTVPDPSASGGVQIGALSYHFERDATYGPGTVHPEPNETKQGWAGGCGGCAVRAIVCCHGKPAPCPCYTQCAGACP